MESDNFYSEVKELLDNKPSISSDLYLAKLEVLMLRLYDSYDNIVLQKSEELIRKKEETIRQIIINTSGSGHDFFNALVLQLSSTLNADYTFIAEFIPENLNRVKTIATCHSCKLISNFEYDLKDTPCSTIADGIVCTWPSDVVNTFPNDTLLFEMGICGYTGIPLLNSNKKPIGIMVALFCTPITNTNFIESVLQVFSSRVSSEMERLQTEKALRDSEKRYHHITESITDYIVKVYVNSGIVTKTIHGSGCIAVTGYTTKEYESDIYLWFKMIDEDDRKTVREKVTSIIQGSDCKAFEHRIYHKNGTKRWIRNNPVLFRNENDEIYEYNAIISDITDLKEVELKMLENEKQYHLLFSEMKSGCALHEIIYDELFSPVDYRFVDVNPVFENQTGLKKADIIGLSVKQVMPDTEQLWIERYGQVASTGIPCEFESYSAVNNKYYEVSAYSPRKGFFAAVYNDITDRKKAEAALRKSEERFAMAMEAANDGIFEWNLKTNDVYFSPQNFKILGYKPNEMKSSLSQWFGLIHPDDVAKTQHAFKEHLLGKIPNYEIEFRIKSKSGEYKWILERGKILERSDTNEAIHVVGVHTDIDIRKKAEGNLRIERDFNSLITQTSPVGIISTNNNGDITFANTAAEMLFGISKLSNLLYSTINANIYDLNNKLILNNSSVFSVIIEANKPVTDKQFCIKWQSGEKRFISVNATPILNENGYYGGMVAIINDISAYHLAQKDLLKAKERAEESDKLKSAFLANMSHEIRTPMNGIIGFSSLLSKEDIPIDKRTKYINIIQNSTSQLLAIITDILDISKIEAGQLNIIEQRFNINESLEQLQTQFEIEKKIRDREKIEIYIYKDLAYDQAFISSDRARIIQIISNLLSNSIKFTEKGSIEFGYKFTNKSEILFYVKDTGIGISIENQDIIFDRFRQVDGSVTRKYGGTGLGLAITKGLLNLMGGKIWLESEPNVGTTFYFTLPYKLSKNEVENYTNVLSNPSLVYNWEEKTILIVEDVEDNYDLLIEFLEDTHVAIHHAVNGAEALKMIGEKPDYDLVLMDIQLPDTNGYEVTKQIRASLSELKIIAQTAYGLSGDREKALDAGCNDYISKPVIKSIFMTLIDKYI